MATFQIESVDGLKFKFAGLSFLKGDYYVAAKDTAGTTVITITNKYTREVLCKEIMWTNFRDSTGTAYGTLALCSADIASILAKDLAENSLVTDKANVTQLSTISTGVTIAALNGKIVTVSSTLAADAAASIVVTNSKVTTAQNIFLTVFYAGTQGVVVAEVTAQSAGSFTIKLVNAGTQALNNTITIGFLLV